MLPIDLRKILEYNKIEDKIVSVLDYNLADNSSGFLVASKHQVVKDIRRCITILEEEFGILSPDQRAVSEMSLAAASRFIFGDLLNLHASEIFNREGWKLNEDGTVPKGILLSAPRRFGKTRIFAIQMASIVSVIAGVTILGIAAEPGPAELLCAEIITMVKFIFSKTGVGKIVRESKEHIFVKIGDRIGKIHIFSARKGDG